MSRESSPMPRALTHLIIVVSLLIMAGCDDGPERKLISVEGEVRFIHIEGGFWGIAADNGTVYEPINLPADFMEDGLPVRILAEVRDDLGSIHMVGPIIEILNITRL